MKKAVDSLPIALSLSGGGIRAMAYHLGVLKYMAERGMLERVSKISTVSGGSLITGLIYQNNNFSWPSSKYFLEQTYPHLENQLCTKSMMRSSVMKLFNPCNWRYLLSRANILAKVLATDWQIDIELSSLSAVPEWSINGTTAESGKRFRFKRDDIGDYTLGYANPNAYPLANAMAVSAAFPGGFGPLALKATEFRWRRRPTWNSPPGSEIEVEPPFKKIHLYDGGVYDNLGLEPFFNHGTAEPKISDHYLVVSDAGAPLKLGFSLFKLNPFRLLRVADIMSDQSHALRVRSLWTYINRSQGGAVLIDIIEPITGKPCTSAQFCSTYPTNLNKLTLSDFERLSAHGYGIAKKRFEAT